MIEIKQTTMNYTDNNSEYIATNCPGVQEPGEWSRNLNMAPPVVFDLVSNTQQV